MDPYYMQRKQAELRGDIMNRMAYAASNIVQINKMLGVGDDSGIGAAKAEYWKNLFGEAGETEGMIHRINAEIAYLESFGGPMSAKDREAFIRHKMGAPTTGEAGDHLAKLEIVGKLKRDFNVSEEAIAKFAPEVVPFYDSMPNYKAPSDDRALTPYQTTTTIKGLADKFYAASEISNYIPVRGPGGEFIYDRDDNIRMEKGPKKYRLTYDQAWNMALHKFVELYPGALQEGELPPPVSSTGEPDPIKEEIEGLLEELDKGSSD
jgi:hypothetical protein